MTPGPAPKIPTSYHISAGINGGGGGGSLLGGYVAVAGGGSGGSSSYTAFVNRTYFTGNISHSPELSSWRPWFAWRPVKVYDEWKWLTRVYRKKEYYDLENISEPIKFKWSYGTIFDMLKEEQNGTN